MKKFILEKIYLPFYFFFALKRTKKRLKKSKKQGWYIY